MSSSCVLWICYVKKAANLKLCVVQSWWAGIATHKMNQNIKHHANLQLNNKWVQCNLLKILSIKRQLNHSFHYDFIWLHPQQHLQPVHTTAYILFYFLFHHHHYLTSGLMQQYKNWYFITLWWDSIHLHSTRAIATTLSLIYFFIDFNIKSWFFAALVTWMGNLSVHII